MKSINVTEPFLPPREEYEKLLDGVWDRNWLTNQGPLVCELENKLQQYHGLASPVHCVANGGLGLQIILKALGVKGEVITTPFSYVATTSCPLWEGCSLRFADIEPNYLTVDPKAVEAAITPRTEAILATHVFGNPCDVDALETIARKHGLALIYDAAHAFGVNYQGKSILEYGDASMVSTHATKVFHTVEGGFVTARDPALSEKIEWMRRFGHDGAEEFHGVGMNAKMSEFHAAMGHAVFDHLPQIISGRQRVIEQYQKLLDSIPQVSAAMVLRDDSEWNFAYFPVIYQTESALLSALARLQENGITARRYFYPSLDTLDFADKRGSCPISAEIASRIACLPLYSDLSSEIMNRIIQELGF